MSQTSCGEDCISPPPLSAEAKVLQDLMCKHLRAAHAKDEKLRSRLFALIKEYEDTYPTAMKELT